MMPPRGAVARAETVATVQRISHEMFVSDETGRLIEAAARTSTARPPTPTRRRWSGSRAASGTRRGACRVELAADLARASSVGHEAWVEARERSDFAGFVPYLERNIELVREYIDCFDDFDCAYDVLLDDYEPGGRTSEVARLFDELKAELRPLIAVVEQHHDRVDDSLAVR